MFKSTASTVVMFLVTVVVLIAIALIGWQANWWFAKKNTDYQRQIDQRNYGTQLGYIQKIDNEIVEVANIDATLPGVSVTERSALHDQRQAIVVQICTTASLLTNVPTNIEVFSSTNCN